MGADQTSDREPILSRTAISKQFPGAEALDKVDFVLFTGEVHALTGENGAGKNILINIISGLLQPNAEKQSGWPRRPALAVLGALLVGLVIGLLNGVLISKLQLPAFVVTFGMMSTIRGIALLVTLSW